MFELISLLKSRLRTPQDHRSLYMALGYQNTNKAAKHLARAFEDGFLRDDWIFCVAQYLDLSIESVQELNIAGKRDRLAQHHAERKAEFKPHIDIVNDGSGRPPAFVHAVGGQWRKIRLPYDIDHYPESERLNIAQTCIHDYLREAGNRTPYGDITQFIVYLEYGIGHCFDAEGKPLQDPYHGDYWDGYSARLLIGNRAIVTS